MHHALEDLYPLSPYYQKQQDYSDNFSTVSYYALYAAKELQHISQKSIPKTKQHQNPIAMAVQELVVDLYMQQVDFQWSK